MCNLYRIRSGRGPFWTSEPVKAVRPKAMPDGALVAMDAIEVGRE